MSSDEAFIDLSPVQEEFGYTIFRVRQPVRIASLGFRGLGPGTYRMPGKFERHLRYPRDLELIHLGILSVEYKAPTATPPVPEVPEELKPVIAESSWTVYEEKPNEVQEKVKPSKLKKAVIEVKGGERNLESEPKEQS